MKLIGYAGFRKDNGALVEAFLHESGNEPTVRLFTEDRVRVKGVTLFELELPTGMTRQNPLYTEMVRDILRRAIFAIDPLAMIDVRKALRNHPAGLTPEDIGYERWVESELMRVLAITISGPIRRGARSAIEDALPNFKLL